MHVFVSGSLALDFVGTLKWRRSDRPEELLVGPHELDAWFVESGLVSVPPGSSAEDLRRALVVREAAYRAVRAVLVGERLAPADADVINRAAAGRPVTPVLVGTGRESSGTPPQALSSIARATIDVLTRDDGTPMKECVRPECTRVFLDHSHGHRRTWCGMAECGNRAKAAAYRRRRRTGAVRVLDGR